MRETILQKGIVRKQHFAQHFNNPTIYGIIIIIIIFENNEFENTDRS